MAPSVSIGSDGCRCPVYFLLLLLLFSLSFNLKLAPSSLFQELYVNFL